MLIRRSNGEWFPLHKNELFEDGRFRPLGFSHDEDTIYVLSSHITGRDSVFRFNLDRGELAGKVFEHDTVDINGLIVSHARRKAVGVSYTVDTTRIHYLDPEYARLKGIIDNTLPDRVNSIVSITPDEKFVVIFSRAATNPGEFYLYDSERRKLQYFGRQYKNINPEDLAPVRRVTFEARDSLQIPAYLTVPTGESDGLRPGVVMPHGGPWLRDYLTFDPWVQFLANRGYVVLQPNFRGSSGYGDRFEALGYGGWGRAMQDDITDAARWLIDQELVDPERIVLLAGHTGAMPRSWELLGHLEPLSARPPLRLLRMSGECSRKTATIELTTTITDAWRGHLQKKS